MLGKPKYKIGDLVSFSIVFKGKKLDLIGTIEIIDAHGTFGYSDDVSYDIMVEDFPGMGKTLCKHNPETTLKLLTKK